MNPVVFLAVCVIGTSLAQQQDCSAKIQTFHQCLKDSHKQQAEANKAKFQTFKTDLENCYKNNGCQPPQPGQSGSNGQRNNTQGGQCFKAVREAMKQQVQKCVQQANPGVTLPEEDESHHKAGFHHGPNHKGDNKALDSCANKQAVRDCTRALFNKTKPSDADKKAKFQANCDARQKCLDQLGPDCQAQLEKIKQSACQCRQQQNLDQIRSGIPACAGVSEGKRPGAQQGQKQHSCEAKKDYCKLGYDAFVQDHQGQHHGGKGGQGQQ